MFGYVRPYRPSATFADYEFYRAVYCGLCRAMKKQMGSVSSMTLNYDMVFLALLRLLVGENQVSVHPHRCVLHPVKPRAMVVDNPAVDYAARAGVLLAYRKMEDDVRDARFLGRIPPETACAMLRRARKKAGLESLDKKIEEELAALSQMEREQVASIDLPAAAFGRLLGAVFSEESPDEYRENLRLIGDTVGRFIYAADAAEDFPHDVKSGSYNPYVLTYGSALTPEKKRDIHDSLICILAEGESAWQTLPFENAGITSRLIRNILSEGLPARIDFLLQDTPVKRGKKKITPYDGPLP